MPDMQDIDRLRLQVFTLVSVRVSLIEDRLYLQPCIRGACSAEVLAQVEGAITDSIWPTVSKPCRCGLYHAMDRLTR